MSAQAVDLERTLAPRGLVVEIEGRGKLGFNGIGQDNLLEAIGTVYVVLTGQAVISYYLLPRVQVLSYDETRKHIKVKVRD